KVNSVTFASGDAVYFRGSGDRFYGQIAINRSNVTLGAYEAGISKPVITGAVQLTGWTVYSGSIYVAQASSFVKNLFASGVQMTLARFPNSGFIPITSKSSSTTFTASGITQASGYWNGANCRLRTNAWTFESPKVSTQTGGTIVLTSAPRFDAFTTGWGFYLDNKLAALDAPGEWYCDPATNIVYFYAPGGVNPNTLTIFGSVLDYGVTSSSNYITVKDLEFQYQCKAGINLSGRNCSVQSNNIYGGLENGIRLGYGTDCVVTNNNVQNVNGNGIHASGMNSTVSNNCIKSIALVKGYQSFAKAYGIMTDGTYTTVSNNYIDSIGYDGIYASSHDIVQYNLIKNTLMTLADGGAIYTGSGNSYVRIQNNVIVNVFGNSEGTGSWTSTWNTANGIYLDYGSSDDIVQNNTIIRAGSMGLMANYNTRNHTFRNNTCYNCASNDGGYFLYLGINVSYNYGGHVITKNIFYPAYDNQRLIQVQDHSTTLHSPGIIDSNYYLNPHGNALPFETLIKKTSGWSVNKYTFSGWKALIGQEAHSKYIIPESYKRDTIFVNNTASPVTINLPPVVYYDLDNNSVVGSFTLAPFSSKVLIKDTAQVHSTITVNPSAVSFGDVVVNTSGELTYTVSGSNLTPASGNIVITSQSSAYQVSLTAGSGFTSSLNVPYSDGTLSQTTIRVKFSPTDVTSYTGTIMNSSGGASTKYVNVTGSGVSTTTPALSVSPSSLTFGNVIINTNSSDFTYTLAGTNLSPASGNISITPPAAYQVSLTAGSGYTSSLNIAYTGGTLSSRTIYVRFSPTVAQTYSGNISNSGGGATLKNISVVGTGISISTPVISVSPGLLAFSTVRIGQVSTERIYTLQGSYLTPDDGLISINAPEGYQVSATSGSGFASSISIPYTNGLLSSRLIYVRFIPMAEQSYSGSITNTGGGAPVQNVALTGTGISSTSAALMVNPTSLNFGDIIAGTTSNEMSFNLTGINLIPSSDSLIITASDGFYITTTSGSGYTSSLKVPYGSGMLIPRQIYVRFSPVSVQNYYGVITCSGGTSAAQTVAVSGNSISQLPPTLTVEPAFLAFGNVANNTMSSAQYYTLTGSNLSPASGNIIITAPGGFQVSTTAVSGFESSITLSYSGGVLASTTIYGRFLPTQLTTYNGSIMNDGGGASTVMVPVSGTGVLPVISVNPSSLPFSGVIINTVSGERTYNLTAFGLTPASGDITVTAQSSAFEVSLTSGSGFSSSVNIPYSDGSITIPRMIYVRFHPTTEENYSGTVTNSGGGAANQDISVSGIGVSSTAPLIMANPASLSFGNISVNSVSSRKSYSLSGINMIPPDGTINIKVPEGFDISASSGSGFDTSLTINYTGGALADTSIFVRFCPTEAKNYGGEITNIGGGTVTVSVYVSGSSLSPVLNITPDSLAFGSVTINSSSVKTYMLSGLNFQPPDDTLQIIATDGFTLSAKADSGFSSEIKLPYYSSTLLPTTIYVKFTPAAVQNYTGSISHSCGGTIIRDLKVSGETAVPSLYLNTVSIDFGNVLVNTSSTELIYIINGLNLMPESGNITITAPYGFGISLTSGSDFASSINLPYAKNVLPSTFIYVRFTPVTAYAYAGSILNDGGGANTKNVTVSGMGIDNASIYASADSLYFGSLIVHSMSSEKSYVLSGINLAVGGTIRINSSRGFEVSSASGAGFDTSISITYDGNALSSQTIYVRFCPSDVGNYSGFIANTGNGAQALNIAVSGISLPFDKIVQLGQNFPNPFNPATRIPYSIYKKSRVKLTIYNILGQRIRTLIDEEQDVGYYQPEFDISKDNYGQELSSGIYFYRLEIAGVSVTKKLILLK
ncbi:MAG: right-handed parallel beta-helix repeat-containing protein, partial [Bacteroidetes bacterium]|nr:right-handed parallel beta-helix repeat-containing protein [Bacteroidota bacterium]